jgi:hypothetical protein
MTSEQKNRILELVIAIDGAAQDLGYYSDKKYHQAVKERRNRTWKEFEDYLVSISDEKLEG